MVTLQDVKNNPEVEALIKGAHTLNNDIVVINFILCISFGYMSFIYGKRYPFCFFDWYNHCCRKLYL